VQFLGVVLLAQAMDEAARHQASQRYAGPPGSAGWPSSSSAHSCCLFLDWRCLLAGKHRLMYQMFRATLVVTAAAAAVAAVVLVSLKLKREFTDVLKCSTRWGCCPSGRFHMPRWPRVCDFAPQGG